MTQAKPIIVDDALDAIEDHSVAVERMFELDILSDSLVSGRLCGQPVDRTMVELMLVLLERLHWAPQTRQLASALPHFPQLFGLAELRETFCNLGYTSTDQWRPGVQLADCPPETLVCDTKGELWLIRREGRRTYLIQPSAEREQKRRVRESHSYRCIQFERLETTHDTLLGNRAESSWTSDTFSRFTPEMRLLVILTLLSGITAILIAFGITKIFDTVIPTRNTTTLTGIIIGLGVIFCADFALRRIRAGIVGRVSGRMEYILGGALLGKLLRLPSSMFAGVAMSDQMTRLRQFETIRDLFGGPVVLMLLEYPLVILMLVTIAFMAWQLALVLIGLIMAFLTIGGMIAPSVRRASRRQGAAQSRLNKSLLEVLAHRQQIAREGLTEHWVDRTERRLRDVIRARRKLNGMTRWLDGLAHASLPVSAASVIGVGALLAMQGAITSGQLVASTILTWRLFAPVQQTLALLPKLQDVAGLFTQIDTLMKLPEAITGETSGIGAASRGHIEAQGVVLRHPKSIAPTLLGVQLNIPHGALVAMTGRSGSGKTTLLRVMAGQLAPQAGVILLNTLNLAQLSREFRARSISYVSQNPLFFFGSVAQNLRFADPAADDTRLLDVLNEVGLSSWLAHLPEGLNTRIDPLVDNGILTTSVRSCIAVAQALLTHPAVLFLDEPAGGMDPDLEAHLIRALEQRRGDMTCVMVTHRPSLMRRMDSVIFLQSGSAMMRATADLEKAVS